MLRPLILPLAAVGLTASIAVAQSPASFLSVKTPAYDIYASSQTLLDATRTQLDSAAVQFARYFPGPTLKLHVVVAENRDELSRFDVDALRKQVGDVLAWTVTVTRTMPNGGIMEMASGSGPAKIALFGNLSVVLAPMLDAKGSIVRFLPPSGAGTNVDLREADVIRAINGRPVADPSALNEVYIALPVGAQVELRIERKGAEQAITFTKPAGEQRGRVENNAPGRAPGATGAEPRILSHEAGHHLMQQWVTERAGGREKAGELLRARPLAPGTDTAGTSVFYGSPLLPDWLDEAGATISESKSQQAERRKYIVDNFGAIIPFPRFFAAEHPAMPGLREMAKAAAASGQRSTGPMSVRVRSTLDGIDGAMFYAQSLSIAEFLAEREGTSFLSQLAETLMRGQPIEKALESAKNLPKTVDALNAEWLKWVAR